MKIVTVIGTRPQIIKASILLKELKKTNHKNILVYTGQHYSKNLSDIFFQELNLEIPDYNLQIGSGNYSYQIQTGIEHLSELLELEQPDRIVTIGDSNPALVGARTAYQKNIHLVHCEAGLRSNDRHEPEEKNRVFIDSYAHQLFCPTQECLNNLRLENIKTKPILTGDLLYDCWKKYQSYQKQPQLNFIDQLEKNDFCLLTLHRQSNLYDAVKLQKIVGMLTNSWDLPTVFSIHPGTKKRLQELALLKELEQKNNFWMIEPLSYLEMRWMQNNCAIVMTDSVGIQVEAYLCQKPSIILREKTEHHVLEKLGWSVKVNPKLDELFSCYNLAQNLINYPPLNYDLELFGDGNAASKMVDEIIKE